MTPDERARKLAERLGGELQNSGGAPCRIRIGNEWAFVPKIAWLALLAAEEREEKLRKEIKLAITRLEICGGRFRACHEAWDNDHELAGHGVSLVEIPAWIDDMKALLSGAEETNDGG